MSYSYVVNSEVYNTNTIVVFSDRICSFNCNIRSNSKKELRNSRARFKYFPRTTLNHLTYYTDPAIEDGKFNIAVTDIGINDMLNNTSGADNLMQNILKIAA